MPRSEEPNLYYVGQKFFFLRTTLPRKNPLLPRTSSLARIISSKMSIYSVKIASFVQHFGKVNCLHCIVPFIWMHRTKWPSSLHDEPYHDDGWPWFTPGDGDMEQFAILGCKAEDLVDISLMAGGDGEHLVVTMSSM